MILRFPAYRRYSDARVEVNDAMMALLIGARLGEHALSTSAADPDALLPSLFGQIPGIARLNRTAGDAAGLLAEAEVHLASMAIPYTLAVHGAFLAAAAQMVRDAGLDQRDAAFEVKRCGDLHKLPLDTGHEYIAERCRGQTNPALLSLFHIARQLRNRIIHSNRTPGSRLLQEFRTLQPAARESWEGLAGRPLTAAVASGRLEPKEGELVAVLAVSRHLVQDINTLLARKLSREYWARVAVADYRALHPQRFGERARRLRRLQGHAASFYAHLGLTEDELKAAAGD